MSGGSKLNFPIGADLVPIRLIGRSAAVCNAVQFIVGGIMMAIPGSVLGDSLELIDDMAKRIEILEMVTHLEIIPDQ